MQDLQVNTANILRDAQALAAGKFGTLDTTSAHYLENILESARVMHTMLENAQTTPPQDIKRFVHDLRSPLNGLRGFLEMLIYDDHPLNAEQRMIVTQLLDFANHLKDDTARMLHPPNPL